MRTYIEQELAFFERFVYLIQQELNPSAKNAELKQHLAGILASFGENLNHIRHAQVMKPAMDHS